MNKIRWFIAYRLYRLADWICPPTLKGMAKSMEDQFVYGTGIYRIDPKGFYGNSLSEKNLNEIYEKFKKEFN